MNKKGWFNESARHSLAARGINTRAQAVVNTSGIPESNQEINNMTRVYSNIKGIGEELRSGKIGDDTNGLVGGITTNTSPGDEFTFGMIGQIYLELDPEVMLKYNDLIRVKYTPKFFTENMDIAQRVGAGFIEDDIKKGKISDENINELMMYEHEDELVSRTPIVLLPQAIKRIDIFYGDYHHNPITGEEPKLNERIRGEDRSHEFEREIIIEIKKEIPRGYWDIIVMHNAVTDEIKYLRWLI